MSVARIIAASAKQFDPRSIPNLVHWWDASDETSLTMASGAVQTWTSKAGSLTAATQSVANNRPTTTTVNGRTAILFDGANDGFDFTGVARTDETWIIAAAQTADQSGQRQILSDGGNGTGISATKGSVKLFEVAFGGFAEGTDRLRVQYAQTPSTLLGPAIFSSVRSVADGGFVYIDGTQRNSAVGGQSSFTTAKSDTMRRIGYYSSSLFQFQGWIGEILLWSRALSNAERLKTERYLGRKWGVSVA